MAAQLDDLDRKILAELQADSEQSLDEKNPDDKNAKASLALDLDKEDRSDDALFNQILWTTIKGRNPPLPGPRHVSLQQLQQEQ